MLRLCFKINDYSAKNAIYQYLLIWFKKSFRLKQICICGKEMVKRAGKTAEKKIITLGLNYNGQTEVTAGLSAGDNLITFGYQDLNEGQLIKF